MDVHFIGIMRSYDLNLVKPQWLLCIRANGWAKTTDAGHDGPIFEFHNSIHEKVSFVVRNLTTPNNGNKQQLNDALLSYHLAALLVCHSRSTGIASCIRRSRLG